jgi:hypothetical protein
MQDASYAERTMPDAWGKLNGQADHKRQVFKGSKTTTQGNAGPTEGTAGILGLTGVIAPALPYVLHHTASEGDQFRLPSRKARRDLDQHYGHSTGGRRGQRLQQPIGSPDGRRTRGRRVALKASHAAPLLTARSTPNL